MNVSWKSLSCFAALATFASGCQSQTSPPPTEASAHVEADGYADAEHELSDDGESDVTSAMAKLSSEDRKEAIEVDHAQEFDKDDRFPRRRKDLRPHADRGKMREKPGRLPSIGVIRIGLEDHKVADRLGEIILRDQNKILLDVTRKVANVEAMGRKKRLGLEIGLTRLPVV